MSLAVAKDKLAQIENRVGTLTAVDLGTPPLPTNEWPDEQITKRPNQVQRSLRALQFCTS